MPWKYYQTDEIKHILILGEHWCDPLLNTGIWGMMIWWYTSPQIICLFFEIQTALKFLEHALTLYQKYDVTFCLKTALLYHVIARTHSCRGDFRTALQMEKEAFGIYSRIFGKDHEKTMLSSECLKHLTVKNNILNEY